MPYQRPADWLTLPTLTEGEQRFVGLHAVFDHDSNFVALSCAGDYTVDWGDGTVTNYASGATAEHNYDYSDSALDGTETTRGYKQAIVSVTMQAGQTLTSINLQIRHSLNNATYATGWLDINAVGSSISSYSLGGTTVEHGLIEITNFIGSNVISDFTSFYRNCFSAQSFSAMYTSMGANFTNFYQNCYSAQSFPLIDTSSGTIFTGFYRDCYSAQSFPLLDTSSGTEFSSFYQNCYSAQSFPLLDTSSGTEFSSFYQNCRSAQSFPLLDTSSGTEFSSFYRSCFTAQSFPTIDVSSGENFSNFYLVCRSGGTARVSGVSRSISVASMKLSANALEDVFNGLADLVGQTSQTITISGNWGASLLSSAQRDIALNKNWTIVG